MPFFETPRKPADQKNNQNVEKKVDQNSITPTITQPQIIKKLTREESISNSKRVKVENDSILGSINLQGALIDDIFLKSINKS